MGDCGLQECSKVEIRAVNVEVALHTVDTSGVGTPWESEVTSAVTREIDRRLRIRYQREQRCPSGCECELNDPAWVSVRRRRRFADMSFNFDHPVRGTQHTYIVRTYVATGVYSIEYRRRVGVCDDGDDHLELVQPDPSYSGTPLDGDKKAKPKPRKVGKAR